MEQKLPKGRTVICLRCNHAWVTSLVGRDPLACPLCKSPYWNLREEILPKPRPRKSAVLAE